MSPLTTPESVMSPGCGTTPVPPTKVSVLGPKLLLPTAEFEAKATAPA